MCPIMVIGRKETVWMDFAKVMVMGIVSNLEILPQPNPRKLSFKNANILAYAWVICSREFRETSVILVTEDRGRDA